MATARLPAWSGGKAVYAADDGRVRVGSLSSSSVPVGVPIIIVVAAEVVVPVIILGVVKVVVPVIILEVVKVVVPIIVLEVVKVVVLVIILEVVKVVVPVIVLEVVKVVVLVIVLGVLKAVVPVIVPRVVEVVVLVLLLEIIEVVGVIVFSIVIFFGVIIIQLIDVVVIVLIQAGFVISFKVQDVGDGRRILGGLGNLLVRGAAEMDEDGPGLFRTDLSRGLDGGQQQGTFHPSVLQQAVDNRPRLGDPPVAGRADGVNAHLRVRAVQGLEYLLLESFDELHAEDRRQHPLVVSAFPGLAHRVHLPLLPGADRRFEDRAPHVLRCRRILVELAEGGLDPMEGSPGDAGELVVIVERIILGQQVKVRLLEDRTEGDRRPAAESGGKVRSADDVQEGFGDLVVHDAQAGSQTNRALALVEGEVGIAQGGVDRLGGSFGPVLLWCVLERLQGLGWISHDTLRSDGRDLAGQKC